MSDALDRLEADRQMRNAARKLVDTGIRNLRSDMDEQGVGSRLVVRMREGAEGAGDDIVAYVRQNRAQAGSALAVGTALALGWIFRGRLAETISKLQQERPPAAGSTIRERIASRVRSIRD